MEYDEKLIRSYWERYIQGYEQIPDHLDGLDDRITASWKRSKTKANPFENKPTHLSQSELAALLEQNKALLQVAYPYLIRFYEIAKRIANRVLLTDAEGRQLLNITADNAELENLMKSASVNDGTNYSEDASGTSTVGLALYYNEPFVLRGYEHYRYIYHDLTCFGAPIHSMSGKIIGAVCVTGSIKDYQPFAMNALMLMVQAIENEVQMSGSNRVLTAIVSQLREGYLLLDSSLRILQLNPAVSGLFSFSENMVGHTMNEFLTDDLLPLIRSGTEQTILLHRKNHSVIPVSIRPMVLSEHEDQLYLLMISPANPTLLAKESSISGYTIEDIIAHSPESRKVKQQASLAAESDSNVLISGEYGVGKSFLAHAIHNGSARKSGPFVEIHCADLSTESMKLLLLGDLSSFQQSKLEMANHGTLFLDHVEGLSMEMQSLVNDCLETGMINGKRAEFRIIASTRLPLNEIEHSPELLRDLYYKLSPLTIQIPPLRERRQDILEFAEYYRKKYALAFHRRIGVFDEQAREMLYQYDWPGNVIEIENVVEHAAGITQRAVLRVSDLPENLVLTATRNRISRTLSESQKGAAVARMETEYSSLIQALHQTHGNVKAAAAALQIPLSTIYRKLDKYSINPKDYREW